MNQLVVKAAGLDLSPLGRAQDAVAFRAAGATRTALPRCPGKAPPHPRPGPAPGGTRGISCGRRQDAALAGAGGGGGGRGGRGGASPGRRALWPVLTGLCAALLCLCQALRGAEGAAEAGSALLLLGCLLARCCAEARGGGGGGGGGATDDPASGEAGSLRGALERFHARELRVSPHVLGHSKAHVGRVVAELVRAAKAQGLRPGPLALSLRGDFVRVGSAYEQHAVRGPERFDVLVPLRLPPPLEPRGAQGGAGAFACSLRARAGAEPRGRGQLSAALVLRWFRGHVRRCLGAVRYRLRDSCRVSLSAAPGRPPTLHIAPRSDYVCCHVAMAVRLVPAVPLGDALYLTAPPPRGPAALWGLDASRQEQRLLGWVKERAPAAACHLKCLQILKGLRDLRRRGLDEPLGSQWGRVLSSYVLKTAVLSLLLRGPLGGWDERFLVERLEELVLYLRDCLRKRVLMHLFLGNVSLPEAVAVPRFLREATPVNLLAAFDGVTLDLVAFQLVDTWFQAPRIIRMYSSPRYWRPAPVPCRHVTEAEQDALRERGSGWASRRLGEPAKAAPSQPASPS
ncbi:inositol 1,4,5-trisphosphate receptor-interacting protein-like 2 [Cuculus canorus]|uniref:inositol 1,4,5-trisphosphate receptor-interacting protein-like 2 n=1 Tax=Cuculus canorus TaxID=55661 RepID=UPI0023AB349F|nr:inositol 1,4,5-trisphosphate receptor-interacting protein-like 2 [Cuculus canorus]